MAWFMGLHRHIWPCLFGLELLANSWRREEDKLDFNMHVCKWRTNTVHSTSLQIRMLHAFSHIFLTGFSWGACLLILSQEYGMHALCLENNVPIYISNIQMIAYSLLLRMSDKLDRQQNLDFTISFTRNLPFWKLCKQNRLKTHQIILQANLASEQDRHKWSMVSSWHKFDNASQPSILFLKGGIWSYVLFCFSYWSYALLRNMASHPSFTTSKTEMPRLRQISYSIRS